MQGNEAGGKKHVNKLDQNFEAEPGGSGTECQDNCSTQDKLDVPEHADFRVRPITRQRIANRSEHVVGSHENEDKQERKHNAFQLPCLDKRCRAKEI